MKSSTIPVTAATDTSMATNSPKTDPLFGYTTDLTPMAPAGLPLRKLSEALARAPHPLQGAALMHGDAMLVAIKALTRLRAEDIPDIKAIQWRWDTAWGAAVTITLYVPSRGMVGRAWIFEDDPAIRGSQKLQLAVYYSGTLVCVAAPSATCVRGHRIVVDALPKGAPEDYRSSPLIAKDASLAYWSLFRATPVWKPYLTSKDHLRVGWEEAFYCAARIVASLLRDGCESCEPAWGEMRTASAGAAEELETGLLSPVEAALRGELDPVQFASALDPASVFNFLIHTQDEERFRHTPDLLRLCVSAPTRTEAGLRVPASHGCVPEGADRVEYVQVDHERLTKDAASRYWHNVPDCFASPGLAQVITPNTVIAHLEDLQPALQAIDTSFDTAEAEAAVRALLDEVSFMGKWCVPNEGRVQITFGPYVEVRLQPFGDEIFAAFTTPEGACRFACFNPRLSQLNARHTFTNAGGHDDDAIKQLNLACKLLLAAIVRDFMVVEVRESVFGVVRRPALGFGPKDGPQIVYIPKVRYIGDRAPDLKRVMSELDYAHRTTHHVRAHLRQVPGVASAHQRTLAARYGFKLQPGQTFVRPHERGGISPDREVIYRSRSAMQCMYGTGEAIVSAGTSDWFKFERDIARAFTSLDYVVDHTAADRNGDDGIDVFAQRGEEFLAIQCKCYAPNRPVGPSVIRELAGALQDHPTGTVGMVVTTSSFTAGAIALAERLDIRLVTLEALLGGNPG
jgi:hypothetical protein